jgi:ubiquinone/menaquinone biosynthesis C-methylase UbiE
MRKAGTFEELLEELLPSPDHPLYAQHKQYNLDAVKRGRYIAHLLGLPRSLEGIKVLDIGCGTGGISVAFAEMNAQVYAMEPNYTHPLLMDITRARAAEAGVSLNACVGRGEMLPFADRSCDIVILNDVLEHAGSPGEVMNESARVLKRGGLMYISTPNRYSYAQIFREGHSGLFGVSLLPPRLAAYYVTRIRKVKQRYTVNTIHSYGMVKRYLIRLALNFVLVNAKRPARHFRPGHPDRPAHYRNSLVNIVVKLCRAPLIRELISYIVTRPSLQPGMLEFVAAKGDIPPAIHEKYRLGLKQ